MTAPVASGWSELAGWGLYGTRVVKELDAYFFPSWRRQFERGPCKRRSPLSFLKRPEESLLFWCSTCNRVIRPKRWITIGAELASERNACAHILVCGGLLTQTMMLIRICGIAPERRVHSCTRHCSHVPLAASAAPDCDRRSVPKLLAAPEPLSLNHTSTHRPQQETLRHNSFTHEPPQSN